jgi:PTS system cellobiose-specific IIC component
MSRSSAASKPSSAASRLQAFAQAPFLVAVRDALPWAFGALLAALAIFLAIVSAPFPARISLALLPSFGVMAFALAFALPIALARRARYSLPATLVATLFCFAAALPRPFGPDTIAYLRNVGATGIFLAILMTGVAGAGIGLTRLPRLRASRYTRDALGAGLAIALIGVLVFVGHADISHAIAQMLQPLARMGDSYPALIAIVAVEMLLWLVGVHGPAMLAAIVTPVYLTLQMQNTAAFAAHAPLPHIVVVSLFLFVFPGGSGATLPLAVLLAMSRVARLRRIGRLVLAPALVNVNEPLIFGLPIVLNPYFAVPFVAVPLLLASVTYTAVAGGVVARPAFYIPSSVPAPISTYLATLDPRAPALLCINLAIALVLYLPFVRAYERHVEAVA